MIWLTCTALSFFWLSWLICNLITRLWYPHRPPIIGANIPFIGCTFHFLLDPIEFLNKTRAKYGNVFTLYIGGVNITMCTETSTDHHIKLFYHSKEDILSLYGAIENFFSCVLPVDLSILGVFDIGQVKKLKTAQHKILPNMKIYIQTMITQINKFFNDKTIGVSFYEWNNNIGNVNNGLVDLFQVLPPLIISINASCIVAKEISTPKYQARFIKCQKIIENALDSFALYVHKSIQWMIPSIRHAHAAFHDMALLLVDIMIDRAKSQSIAQNDLLHLLSVDEFTEEKITDTGFLNNLMNDQVKRNRMYAITVKTFSLVYAGGTVSKAVSYCLIELLQRPSYLQRFLEEQRAVITENSNGSICDISPDSIDVIIDHLSELKFSEACIHETLRRLTGPIVIRKVRKSITIDNGMVIPAGHLLGLSPYLLHHDPNIYKNPYVFDPDRWKNIDNRPGRIFHAFGGGWHICIGMKMAIAETKIIMNKMATHFDWEISNEVVEPNYTIVGIAKPKKPCLLRYRKYNF
jgi:cytochrome P450